MIWKEEQVPSSVAVGLIVMAIGIMIFAIGQFIGRNTKKTSADIILIKRIQGHKKSRE